LIEIDLNKSIEENAGMYFDKAKKARKKKEGAEEALAKSLKKLEALKKERPIEKEKMEKKEAKKEWYEKFRWFISSEGFLCIGGRDATSNEIIIKKHAEKHDIVFHTDMAGSPFFVVKTEGKKAGKATLEEAAQATASWSRAWKLGAAMLEVFYVKPEQVSKKTKAGEYMPKGAFMIYGKTAYMRPELRLAVGIKDGKTIAGPVNAVKKNADKYVIIEQGREKASAVAKKIKAKIGGDIDDIIRMLPAGGAELK
jgi:predicted ribosome quality control (RQC) complex YloA/Tae2 family protein